jgi:hypothetical protein
MLEALKLFSEVMVALHTVITSRMQATVFETFARYRKGINRCVQVSRAIPCCHAPRDDRVLPGFRWGILCGVY